uniref:Uncharacterized protein n=1 Tax=Thermofilum pendens TaxID=2269 RepID=A0A7J3X9L4_THEPE
MPARYLRQLLEPKTLALMLLAFTVFVSAGFIYVLVERPPPTLGVYFFYPGTGAQTISEMLVVAFLYAIGIAGLLMIYEAPKYRYRRQQLGAILTTGLLLTVISALLLILIYTWK